MDGGTYAEALKVGFTPEQSGFLGRFGAETKSECAEEVLKTIKLQKDLADHKKKMLIGKIAEVISLLVIGSFLGTMITGIILKSQV